MQNPHKENTTQSWWVGSVGKVRTWGPRIHANPDSYTHLQCQHSDEEVGDRDKRNPRRCTLLWRTRDPFSNKKDSRNRHLRLSTYTPWHTQTHAHVLRHKNMHSCIHTHSHTQRLKKYSMAFETKTASQNPCFILLPYFQPSHSASLSTGLSSFRLTLYLSFVTVGCFSLPPCLGACQVHIC